MKRKYFVLVLLEINSINKELFCGVTAGTNIRSICDLGLTLNYITNFSSVRCLSVRPHIGFIFLPPIGNVYCEIGYDVFLIKPNFDLKNRWLVGIRYNVGPLKRDN